MLYVWSAPELRADVFSLFKFIIFLLLQFLVLFVASLSFFFVTVTVTVTGKFN